MVCTRLHNILPLFVLLFIVSNIAYVTLMQGFSPEGLTAAPSRCALAFGILVSGSDFQSLSRMLDRILDRDSVFCIFLDGKANSSVHDEVIKTVRALDSTNMSPYRLKLLMGNAITYRGITHTIALLDLMECARAAYPNFTFWINLSASDYPLLSARSLRSLLCTVANHSLSYIGLGEAKPREDIYMRWRQLYVDPALSQSRKTSLERVGKHSPYFPPALPILKGSDWLILTPSFVTYALGSPASRRLFAYFANTASTSESFFSTLMSVGKFPFAMDNLRYIVWNTNPSNSKGQHPAWLEAADHFSGLAASGALFARKFTPTSPLLDLIDEQFLNDSSAKARILWQRAAHRIANATVLSLEQVRSLKFLPSIEDLDRTTAPPNIPVNTMS